MEARIMAQEDKMQTVMNYIKFNDLEYQPQTVNSVLSMNKYDEVSGV